MNAQQPLTEFEQKQITATISNLHTQDNRITDAPLWLVEELVKDYGIAEGYTDYYDWMDNQNEHAIVTDKALVRRLNALLRDFRELPSRYERVGYRERWQFVTACLTEQGCKDFIARDGHNHGKLRIFAAGSYRNEEYRAIRKMLMLQLDNPVILHKVPTECSKKFDALEKDVEYMIDQLHSAGPRDSTPESLLQAQRRSLQLVLDLIKQARVC